MSSVGKMRGAAGAAAFHADTAGTGEILAFQDAGKVFPDGTEAVRSVSFSLRQGEFAAVIGPSGCGKSTLLRMASGLSPETSGQVVRTVENVGYVFQDATLLPWRTVRKNVELLGELEGLAAAVRATRAKSALRLVGLESFADHYPKALSGGMKMRVSLARALTMNPPLFLFDEPFGALDEITRSGLNEELLRLFVSERFAAVFITHSIGEAVYLSSRVLVMSPRPGRIVAEFDVPFDYPRSPDLRYQPEFGDLASAVSHALREARA